MCRDLLLKLLFAAPRCLKMLPPAKAFGPSHVWEPSLTKPVQPGDSVEPLPAALAPCASPEAGLHAGDPAQLRPAVWYVIPESSASQSFTRDSLCEHKSKGSLRELIPSLDGYFSTFGKIIAAHHLVGYGFMIGLSKFSWLLKV